MVNKLKYKTYTNIYTYSNIYTHSDWVAVSFRHSYTFNHKDGKYIRSISNN